MTSLKLLNCPQSFRKRGGIFRVCVECLLVIVSWWLFLVPLEVDATLGDGCGIWEHLRSSGKWNVSRVIPRLYRNVYKIIRLTKSIAADSEAVVTAVFQLGMSQFVSPGWLAFNSRFTKFVLGTSGGTKFVILVEESDTGGPSLITVRLEYLLWNSDVVNLVWESNMREAGSITVNFCYLGVLWSSVGESWWGGIESLSESVQYSLV